METVEELIVDNSVYKFTQALIRKFVGELVILILPNGYYIAEFVLVSNKDRAFEGGPYNIGPVSNKDRAFEGGHYNIGPSSVNGPSPRYPLATPTLLPGLG